MLLAGLFGSYLYWRFARVIGATGEGALAFYRGAAPKASEIFGAPFAIFAGIWDLLEPVLGLFRSVALQFFSLLVDRRNKAPEGRGAAKAPTAPTPKVTVKREEEGEAGE